MLSSQCGRCGFGNTVWHLGFWGSGFVFQWFLVSDFEFQVSGFGIGIHTVENDFSSKANLHQAINFRAECGADEVTLRSNAAPTKSAYSTVWAGFRVPVPETRKLGFRVQGVGF